MNKEKKIKVLVAILTFNCQPKALELTKRLHKFRKQLVLLKSQNFFLELKVFDDCSTDSTIEILSEEIEENNIFKSEENLGYGGNVKKSFQFGIENNFEYLAIFPGDMQRDFDDLLSMINKLKDNDYDAVVGRKSKFINFKNMPIQRKLGNFIFTHLSKIWNDQTQDPLAGFKLYKIETCKDIIWLCQNRFGFDLDFSFWSSIRNLNVYSFDASVTYEDHISSMPSTFLQGLTLIIRFFILGIIVQPAIKILQISTKQVRKR